MTPQTRRRMDGTYLRSGGQGHYAGAVRLTQRLTEIEATLPADWETVSLRLTAEEPSALERVAQVLGPMNVGLVKSELAVTLRRAGGAAGLEAARRLFGLLDEERIACRVWVGDVTERDAVEPSPPPSVAAGWDDAIGPLPEDWSDLLCELEIESSTLLPRAALLCAPLNPTRDRGKVGFTFRCARRAGYGASPGMVRRCFERLDAEGIAGRVAVLRVLADTGLVGTQGPVWRVGGRPL